MNGKIWIFGSTSKKMYWAKCCVFLGVLAVLGCDDSRSGTPSDSNTSGMTTDGTSSVFSSNGTSNETPEAQATILISPQVLSFATSIGERETRDFRVRNTSMTATLNIESYAFEGVEGLDVTCEEGTRFDIAPQGSVLCTASLTRQNPEEQREHVKFNSNASNTRGGSLAILVLSTEALEPCLEVESGERIDFGNTRVGEQMVRESTLRNCGQVLVRLNRAVLSEEESFAIASEEWARDARGILQTPIVLVPGERITFSISFTPEGGRLHNGALAIFSNAPPRSLELVGESEAILCEAGALASIIGGMVEPDTTIEARPLETLLLDGQNYYDTSDDVAELLWSIITRPDGSVSQLEPVDGNPAQTRLFLGLAGLYTIEVNAINRDGIEVCAPSQIQVFVTPDETFHIQLTWNNADDDDPNDLLGSDLDLHFMKLGPGRWNQAPYDVYWLNVEPYWNPETPSLDIDDTDGAGPENINLDQPSECAWFAIGVHQFRQMFGTAYATVRIFINGSLAAEFVNNPMTQSNEFWDVARIHWPTGEIFLVNEMYSELPGGEPASVTSEMAMSGLCGLP